jgi:hypothetical protein
LLAATRETATTAAAVPTTTTATTGRRSRGSRRRSTLRRVEAAAAAAAPAICISTSFYKPRPPVMAQQDLCEHCSAPRPTHRHPLPRHRQHAPQQDRPQYWPRRASGLYAHLCPLNA